MQEHGILPSGCAQVLHHGHPRHHRTEHSGLNHQQTLIQNLAAFVDDPQEKKIQQEKTERNKRKQRAELKHQNQEKQRRKKFDDVIRKFSERDIRNRGIQTDPRLNISVGTLEEKAHRQTE